MKVCINCSKTETPKWYSGPTCRTCYMNKRRLLRKQIIYDNRKKWITPEKKKQYEKRHQEVNRETYLASQKRREAKHRADKLNATPKWLSKEQLDKIKNIYSDCPKGYHVDHIVPLKGKEVKGLHVPWNLQYLPASVNISKSNKLT